MHIILAELMIIFFVILIWVANPDPHKSAIILNCWIRIRMQLKLQTVVLDTNLDPRIRKFLRLRALDPSIIKKKVRKTLISTVL
jgi:hypothetical protein